MTEETARQIEADFAIVVETPAGLHAPPGHHWTTSCWPTRWFANDVLLSVSHGASVFLRREDFDVHDPDQVHVEARFFWSQRPGLSWRATAYSAILWCEQGSRLAGAMRRELLDDRASFPKADSLEQLLAMLCDLLRAPLRAAAREFAR